MSRVVYAILDTETGGFDKKTDALLQVACTLQIEEDGGIALLRWSSHVRPPEGLGVSEGALHANGITRESIAAFPDEKAVHKSFLLFLNSCINPKEEDTKAVLVGYNIEFDVGFLRKWFSRCKGGYLDAFFWNDTLDVRSQAIEKLASVRSTMENFKLGSVALKVLGQEGLDAVGKEFGDVGLHDARFDVEITRLAFNKLRKWPVDSTPAPKRSRSKK